MLGTSLQVWRQTLWTDIKTEVMEEGTKAFVKEVKALPKAVRDEDCFKVGTLVTYWTCMHTLQWSLTNFVFRSGASMQMMQNVRGFLHHYCFAGLAVFCLLDHTLCMHLVWYVNLYFFMLVCRVWT